MNDYWRIFIFGIGIGVAVSVGSALWLVKKSFNHTYSVLNDRRWL